MIRWKFWQAFPENAGNVIEDEDPYFWGFALVDAEFDPDFVPLTPADLSFGEDSYAPSDEQAEHMKQFTNFSYWKERKPIPPRSAVLMPPRLNKEERQVVQLVEVLGKHSDVQITLRPALKKKLREIAKGERRVVFDDKGKMKEAKKARV